MKISLAHPDKVYRIDVSKPLDISIPVRGAGATIGAWYLEPPTITPHCEEGFVGSVSEGGFVNFNDIWFNPHSHVTHTESIGHISETVYDVQNCLDRFFFTAKVITVVPREREGDLVITQSQLQREIGEGTYEAVVIRTLPNTDAKETKVYSHTNPPYLLEEAAQYLKERGVLHLLVDLPSVDKEKDNGLLLAHKAFWDFNGKPRMNATITEFIYVDTAIPDGNYVLNLQVAPFVNDASPSRPVLYQPL
ncbi:MAG: cyclase family protein [Bacteroidota bacterium]